MAEAMRVCRLHAPGDVRLSEEPVPVPGAGESLIRVTAVGLCGSDLHWFGEGAIGDARLDRPLVLGHEFAGVVVDGPRRGRRVAVDPAIPCGRCATCRAGDANLCPDVSFAGHGTRDGALREYLTWPSALLHPLPDGIDDTGGAMLEPLGVVLHSLNLAHLRAGTTVAVVGCGPLGLLLIQAVRAAGAGRVLAVEPLAHRRAAALAVGADEAWTPDHDTRDVAADVAFDVSGGDAAVCTAMEVVRPGARVVLVGIPDDDHTAFQASLARRKGLTLVLVRRMQDLYDRAIRLVEKGAIDLHAGVSHHVPLEDAAAAFAQAASRRGLKVIVHPSS